jgi:hypothetical protein
LEEGRRVVRQSARTEQVHPEAGDSWRDAYERFRTFVPEEPSR